MIVAQRQTHLPVGWNRASNVLLVHENLTRDGGGLANHGGGEGEAISK